MASRCRQGIGARAPLDPAACVLRKRDAGKRVRNGSDGDVDVDVDYHEDDGDDRAGGKLLGDSGNDDNESYAGVTRCLEGISSRNCELRAAEYFTFARRRRGG